MKTQETVREKIVGTFAEWAAVSATRSGCPIKKTEKVYDLINIPNYEEILDKRITRKKFDNWHKESAEKIVRKARQKFNIRLSFGWAAKLINVYLKTRVYIGGEGRRDLVKWIHPPIDNGLFEGIKEKYGENDVIMGEKNRVKAIKDIGYEDYKEIIKYFRSIAKAEKRYSCPIEIEELWQWPNINRSKKRKVKK
ncbi:hypothetical protein HPY86_05650 [candidate division WOR-3 bacterium]|nr:hypothetical protein [candidate division WOR-3 bacterium]